MSTPKVEVLPIEEGATKRCSKCGLEKSLDCFTIVRNRKHGRYSICRECKSVYDARYRQKNAEKIAKFQHEYWINNQEKIKIKFNHWYKENTNRAQETGKRWAKKNASKVRKYQKQWRQENQDWLKQYHQEYSKNHPEQALAHLRNRRAKKRNAEITLKPKEWKEIKRSYNDRCVYCGKLAISQDHVIPMIRGGSHTADNVVPACISCNSSKGAKPLLVWMYERRIDGYSKSRNTSY